MVIASLRAEMVLTACSSLGLVAKSDGRYHDNSLAVA
jgi:hypothetical protein